MSKRAPFLRTVAGVFAWPLQAGYLAIGQAFDFRSDGTGLRAEERRITVDGHAVRLVTIAPEQVIPTAPRILFCHGGGWVIGGPRAHQGLMRRLAASTGWAVTTVEYRLAPRWPIGTAYADCAAALQVLAGEPGPLFLAGESAGAAMAYVAAADHVRLGASLAGVVLMCPIVDLDRRDGPLASASRLIDVGVKVLGTGWFDDRADAAALSPLRVAAPHGLPPILTLAAGADPLRRDAQALTSALVDAGHDARLITYPRMPHGFVSMARFTAVAATAIDDAVAWMMALSAANSLSPPTRNQI